MFAVNGGKRDTYLCTDIPISVQSNINDSYFYNGVENIHFLF